MICRTDFVLHVRVVLDYFYAIGNIDLILIVLSLHVITIIEQILILLVDFNI